MLVAFRLSQSLPPSAERSDDEHLHHEAAELLRKVAQGDGEAFSDLYDRFSGALLALSLTMLTDRGEAEDALQDVFLTVWSKAGLYDSALGKVVSWLMTITRNKCLDRLRTSKRKRTGLEKARQEMETGEDAPVPGNPLSAREKQEQIGQALSDLPEKQRQAIELAFLKGYTQSEIAELLNEPLGTIKARIRRGLAMMREYLDHESESVDTMTEQSPPQNRES